ncbi:MAG: aldo/keto reductase [Rhodobacterales bacterium]|nr:aldo/keto reductase [Rhodobacterales bacterium]
MRIGLGTVQFGLDYGVSNARGRTPADHVDRILALARDAGVSVIDTAAQYGDAESVLGQHLPAGHGFRLVTKTPAFAGVETIGPAQADALETTFLRSLENLRAERVAGLMIHRVDDLFRPGGDLLFARMAALRDRGLVGRIGASVYDGGQVDRLLDRFAPDIVQVPLNLLDQRLVAGGQLARLAAAGVEVHARSVFLQGLLLMAPEAAPGHFEPWRGHLRACRDRIDAAGTTPLRAALAFALARPEVAAVICGAADADEFAQVLAAAAEPAPPLDTRAFASNDPGLVNPVNWSTS